MNDFLDADDLASIEELKTLLKEEKADTQMFIGFFDYELESDKYPINTIYKTKTAYLWQVLLSVTIQILNRIYIHRGRYGI